MAHPTVEHKEPWRFETRLLHSGQAPDPTTRATAVPICQAVAHASAQHAADLFDLTVPGCDLFAHTLPQHGITGLGRAGDVRGDGLRLSVGIEHTADLEAALAAT